MHFFPPKLNEHSPRGTVSRTITNLNKFKRTLPKSFYKASITQIAKPDNWTKINPVSNIPLELTYKRHQPNISQLNQQIYQKNYTLWLSEVFSRYEKLIYHEKFNHCHLSYQQDKKEKSYDHFNWHKRNIWQISKHIHESRGKNSNLEIEEKLQVEKEHLQKFTANNTHNGYRPNTFLLDEQGRMALLTSFIQHSAGSSKFKHLQ